MILKIVYGVLVACFQPTYPQLHGCAHGSSDGRAAQAWAPPAEPRHAQPAAVGAAAARPVSASSRHTQHALGKRGDVATWPNKLQLVPPVLIAAIFTGYL